MSSTNAGRHDRGSVRGRRRGGATLFFALVCAACDGRPSADRAATLEVLVASDPDTLDPRYVTDAVGMRATRLIHAGLVRLDPDSLEPRPYAARGWRWIDPLTMEIDLREDVRFHSGAPLRARDVVATLRAFASPTVGSRHARVVDAIAEATAEGDDRVVVRLSRSHATLATDLELPILRADQAASPPAPNGSLDGIGPYAVAHVSPGDIRLVPAPGAVATAVHPIELRTVHDENARALRLEAGRADVSLNLTSPTLLPALASQPGLFVSDRPGANLTYVVVEEEHGSLANPRVRRALSEAIDRRTICASLFDGRARPAGGLLPPSLWAASDTTPLPFDPVAARAELGRSGVARVTVLTSTERLRSDVARFVAQELSDAGVDVTVVPLEIGTMIARLNGGDFDLAILQIPELTEPNVLRHFLHGSSVPPAGANRGRVRDAAMDALLDEGDEVVDPTARREIYAKLESREREQMHWLPLWYEDQVVVTSLRARAFVPSAEGRWLSLAAVP